MGLSEVIFVSAVMIYALSRTISTYKPLNVALLKSMLTGSMFEGQLVYRGQVDSTNKYARELAEGRAAPEGTVVVAEYQSAGKGRMSRKWFSEPGANLLFSVLLRPRGSVQDLFFLNCAASIAVVEVLEEQCSLKATIKWPNDVYVGDRKLAGLLGEFSMAQGKLDFVILGIGLNVHWAPGREAEGPHEATSILRETDRRVCRTRLLASILLRFEHDYRMLEGGRTDLILSTYKKRSAVIGREVEVIDQDEKMVGQAVDIDAEGSLIVIGRSGVKKTFKWGDVSIRLGRGIE